MQQFQRPHSSLGAQRFEQIVDERFAQPIVNVQQAEIGVEPNRLAGNPRLHLKQRIAIVQNRVERIGGIADPLARPFVRGEIAAQCAGIRFNAQGRQGRGVSTSRSQ